MTTMPIQAATLISEEVRDLIRTQDDAILAGQILFVSLLKVARSAGLAFKDEQRAFAVAHESTGKMLEARWAIGNELKVLRGLAEPAGMETVLEGCSGKCPAMGFAPAEPSPAPTSAPVPVAA